MGGFKQAPGPLGCEGLAERLARLPANHRRVVVALLEVFLRDLRELARAGAVVAGEHEVAELEGLAARLRGRTSQRNWQAVRTLLEVQLEELNPRRLLGYGPLTADQETAIADLVRYLESLLEPPR